MNFPGFRLPDELLVLRDQIRRVIRDEIIPLEQRIDPDAPELPEEDYQRIAAKTRASGLWALGAPEEYGGGGLDTFAMCVALEECRSTGWVSTIRAAASSGATRPPRSGRGARSRSPSTRGRPSAMA